MRKERDGDGNDDESEESKRGMGLMMSKRDENQERGGEGTN